MLSEGAKEGLEAYFTRDDKTRFTEHQISHTEAMGAESSTSSCFLESEQGSTFTIVVDVRSAIMSQPEHDWQIVIWVDGQLIEKVVRRRGRKHALRIDTMASMENGTTVEGKLTFAKLRTNDNDAEVTLQEAQLNKVGQIEIQFKRGKRGASKGGRSRTPIIAQAEVGVASERGKKLGGAVGSTSTVPLVHRFKKVAFTTHDKIIPFHRMIFNYRIRPVLELMNIIEPPAPQADAEQSGPSTKRKRSQSDVNAEKPVVDTKPNRNAVLSARLKDLERQVKDIAKLPKAEAPAEVMDLTGDDSD